ncbi:MAG TPA: BrnT family toxin [Gallionella sp.]
MMKFEWDTEKTAANLRKHGVSFDESGSVFLDQQALSGQDAKIQTTRWVSRATSPSE